MFADQTLTDLLDALSSPTPTPGGGSAAAMAGAIGASLLAMVAGMSKTKTGSPDDRAALDAARAELLRLRAALTGLIDRDAAAYDLVVAAYKQPKATDAEKAARQASVQAAMRVAAEVPIETMRACAEALRHGRVVADHGNPAAATDVGVADALLKAAIAGGRLNAEVNIRSLTDAALAARLSKEI